MCDICFEGILFERIDLIFWEFFLFFLLLLESFFGVFLLVVGYLSFFSFFGFEVLKFFLIYFEFFFLFYRFFLFDFGVTFNLFFGLVIMGVVCFILYKLFFFFGVEVLIFLGDV